LNRAGRGPGPKERFLRPGPWQPQALRLAAAPDRSDGDGHRSCLGPDLELSVDDGGADATALIDSLGDEQIRDAVIEFALDHAAQGPSTEFGLVALVGEPVEGIGGDIERDALRLEPLAAGRQLLAHDGPQLRAIETGEHHGVVDAVEELRPHEFLEPSHDLGLEVLLRILCDAGVEAQWVAGHELRTEVGSHDDDGVAEVDRAPLAIGEASVVEDLQEQVERIRVRLLDLVEE